MFSHINRLMIGAVLMLSASTSYGITITYTATNLTDTISGEDLWQYDYQVSGSFLAGQSFNLLYNPALYQNLQDPPTVADTASWFPFVVQPDTGLPADGFFNSSALTDLTATAANFSLQFVWLGNGQPGSQPLEFLDDSFSVVSTGNTQEAGSNHNVPEPGIFLLVASGLALLRRSRLMTVAKPV